MSIKRVIRLLAVCVIFICLYAVTSIAASDNTAPMITSYQTDSNKYDYGDKIAITLTIDETGTGVTDIFIDLGRMENASSWKSYGLYKHFNSAIYSGTYTFSFSKDYNSDETLPEGSYFLWQIQLNDGAGNSRQYYGNSSYIDENGNDYILDSSGNEKCYTANGVNFTIGDMTVDNIKVKSFQFADESVGINDDIPVILHMEDGQEGADYTAYLDLTKDNYSIPTQKVSFTYNDDVTIRIPSLSDSGYGRYKLSSLNIKPSSDKRFKTYSLISDEDNALIYSQDDQCLIVGNDYIRVKSNSPDAKYPEVTDISLTPETLTKPGFISGQLTLNIPFSNVRQYNVTIAGKGTNTIKTCIVSQLDDVNGNFSIDLGTSAPSADYYISNIMIYDIYGNIADFQGCGADQNGYVPNLDEDGRQYFNGQNENGEAITIHPTFSSGQFVRVADEFDVAFHSSLSDPELISKIRALQEGETGRIDINGDFIAASELFEAVKGRDVLLQFAYKNYQWVFKGTDIRNPKDIDLHISFKRAAGEEYTSAQDVLIISFPKNGDLPGKANIRIKSDYTYEMYKLHNSIYLYYFNEKTDNLDIENGSGIKAYLDDSDSWCSFDITHNSKFLASGTRLRETGIPLAVNSTFKSGKFTYKVIAGKKLMLTKVNDKKIKSTVIPDTVKYKKVTYKVSKIYSKSFTKCNKLTKVTIGANIESIGTKTFYNCKKLKTVIIKSKLLKKSAVGSNAFAKLNSKAIVKVPKKKMSAYKTILKAKGLKGRKQKIKGM